MKKALAVLVVMVLWLILFFSEQRVLQAWSWIIIASAVFAIISLCLVFLGFFARRGKGYPLFIVAIFPLFLSIAFMFVGHEEHKDFLSKVRATEEVQEKIDAFLLGRM